MQRNIRKIPNKAPPPSLGAKTRELTSVMLKLSQNSAWIKWTLPILPNKSTTIDETGRYLKKILIYCKYFFNVLFYRVHMASIKNNPVSLAKEIIISVSFWLIEIGFSTKTFFPICKA